MNKVEQAEGIIITISEKMIKEKGYKNWLRNFLNAMARHDKDCFYWMRQGSCPRRSDLLYVYLCIGGKVRFRAFFAGSQGEGEMTFSDGSKLFGSAWVILGGPVERPPRGQEFPMKGFRGFRYTEKLF
jgi:hypothetical protein